MKPTTVPTTKRSLFHLIPGLCAGFSIGFLLAYLESVYLIFKVGPFLVDFPFLLKAILIYCSVGAVLGFFVSGVLYVVFFRKKTHPKGRIFAFYFAVFLGGGIFTEIFFYLMDIIPYGGAHKGSFETLFRVFLGLIVSFLSAAFVYIILKKLLSRSHSVSRLQRMRFFKVLLIPASLFLLFALFLQIASGSEKRLIQSKKPGSGKDFPNIILIVIDALRADHLSCYGYPLPTSPNIDALAEQGILFQSSFAASNWSVPTHASLFTGLYPSSHGAYSILSVLREDIPALPEILSQNGYHSISICNNPLLGEGYGLDRGFDLVLGFENEDKVSLTLVRLWQKFMTEDSLADDILDFTEKWVDHCHELKVPHLVFVNLLDVHSPYSPKEPYFSEFIESLDLDKVNLPLMQKFANNEIRTREELPVLLSKFTESDLAYLHRLYDSNIRYVDEQIGNLIRALKKADQLENTLIVITADHGEYLGEHGSIGHVISKLYNPGLKIPLILWLPEKLEPGIEKRYMSQIDVFPTILSILGLSRLIPKNIQGRDLLSDGEAADVIAEFWDDANNAFLRTIISEGTKLIVGRKGGLEMYDIINDPGENTDLFNKDSEKAKTLYETLNRTIDSIEHVKPKIDEKKQKRLKALLKSLGYIDD
ncbi:MAG: sulfatase-like hydrolase/transferase [Candidatus Aminicenantes bacterium]|nr:sulfatase-like hydrolase/transferase [Candidatus Aminicenantes bacterium]